VRSCSCCYNDRGEAGTDCVVSGPLSVAEDYTKKNTSGDEARLRTILKQCDRTESGGTKSADTIQLAVRKVSCEYYPRLSPRPNAIFRRKFLSEGPTVNATYSRDVERLVKEWIEWDWQCTSGKDWFFYSVKLSWRLNSIKLPRAKSCVRWLNCE
jgi:hypothetical protein